MKRLAVLASCGLLAFSLNAETPAESSGFAVTTDDTAGILRASYNTRDLFVFNYGKEWNLPHFFPLLTPSGKNLLIQKTDPYPHHRAFWVSDTVERDGVKGDIYNGYYSGVKNGKKSHIPPYNTAVRHQEFKLTTGTGALATIEESLIWETQVTTTPYPLLDEQRLIKLHSLKDGSYLMDFSFTLTANYGDVKFISDAVHYSWPYLRLNSAFSGESGGKITSDSGAVGQEATNLKPALWIDFSNQVEGTTEGVAMFQWPDENREPRKWLTREYGTFGPRRPDGQSGKPFTVEKGESISQRVGVYVHKGDVQTGNVADVYKQYTNGEL